MLRAGRWRWRGFSTGANSRSSPSSTNPILWKEGPFFEETIYVTPSRLPESWQSRVMDATVQAVAALGLKDGPIHAELRLNDQGPWVIEVGARSIGGLCARGLRLGAGVGPRELIFG